MTFPLRRRYARSSFVQSTCKTLPCASINQPVLQTSICSGQGSAKRTKKSINQSIYQPTTNKFLANITFHDDICIDHNQQSHRMTPGVFAAVLCHPTSAGSTVRQQPVDLGAATLGGRILPVVSKLNSKFWITSCWIHKNMTRVKRREGLLLSIFGFKF